MFNELCEIDMNFTNLSDEKFLSIISHGSSLFRDSQNRSIIKYITIQTTSVGLFFKVVEDIVLYACGICMHWELC